jgi:hypothetical protein
MRASLSKIGQSQVNTRGYSGWCGEPAGNYILRLDKTVFGGERLLLAPARRQTQDGEGREVGNVEDGEYFWDLSKLLDADGLEKT